jgi:hypothetical protein
MTATMTTTTTTTDAILAALATARVLAIDELRAVLGDPADFASAVFALEDAGMLVLSRDCDVIPFARRALLLSEGNFTFTTVSVC